MADGVRSRDTNRPRIDRLGRKTAHLGEVVLGRGFVVGAALAHHIDAKRRMRQLRGEIDIALPLLYRVEILGKSFPIPRHAFGHHNFGNILDPFHQPDEQVTVIRFHRGESDAAIAHHDGRDAVAR